MFGSPSVDKVLVLASHCGIAPSPAATPWGIEELNRFMSAEIERGWQSFCDNSIELCLSSSPPEYEVNGFIAGHLAALPANPAKYLIFGLIRGLRGDEPLPPIRASSLSALSRVAQDLGTVLFMRPSTRPSCARAVACKHGAKIPSPKSFWGSVFSPIFAKRT